MLLSRFWFLLLAVGAILGLSTALLARGTFNRSEIMHADEGLRRDRFAVESLLKLDARARIDALAPIAADETIREAVRTKGQSKVDGQEGLKALKDRLRTMNQQLEELRADLLVAVDAQGVILAQEGKKPARSGAGLGKVPLVEQALSGYLGDDVWVYDSAVYRMAARPIVDRGQYVGAIVHGQRLDATLAQRLSERLGGATVGFFFRGDMISSYTPADAPGAPTQAELTPLLPQVLEEERFKKGERSEAFDVGGRARAVFSLVSGSASAAQVGYALARPYPSLPTPWAIFDQATKEDIDALPKVGLVLGLILLFAAAMGIMYLEHDRPLQVFRKEVDKLAQGQSEELDLAALSRAYRPIGEGVHKGIETLLQKGGGKSRQQKANLDEIWGRPPRASRAPLSASVVARPKLRARCRNPRRCPLRCRRPCRRPCRLPMQRPARPPRARWCPRLHRACPRQAAPRPLRLRLRLERHSLADSDEQEAATVIADVPDDLREAARDDESHFREVFEQYVEMRRQCGESTAELAFEKFVVTLRKNRDQILATRPDTRDVRFTVYVKAGKAAIKAIPAKG